MNLFRVYKYVSNLTLEYLRNFSLFLFLTTINSILKFLRLVNCNFVAGLLFFAKLKNVERGYKIIDLSHTISMVNILNMYL